MVSAFRSHHTFNCFSSFFLLLNLLSVSLRFESDEPVVVVDRLAAQELRQVISAEKSFYLLWRADHCQAGKVGMDEQKVKRKRWQKQRRERGAERRKLEKNKKKGRGEEGVWGGESREE